MQGSPPTIPPNSTLNLEVELLSWQSNRDISGDGGVLRTIVKDSSGYETPGDRDEVLGESVRRVIGEVPVYLCGHLLGGMRNMVRVASGYTWDS